MVTFVSKLCIKSPTQRVKYLHKLLKMFNKIKSIVETLQEFNP